MNNYGNMQTHFLPNVLFLILRLLLVLMFDVYCKCKLIDGQVINSKETALRTPKFCS